MNPTDTLPFSPAAERNQQPILDTLRQVLPPAGHALEIASGTGQHAVWFARHLPGWTWHPTDRNARMLPALAARVAQAGLSNVTPAQRLDVLDALEPPQATPPSATFTRPFEFDVVYCANMLHISPWATCAGLMQLAARRLAPGGLLVVYGPFIEDGVPTAPGNLAFDQSLRGQDASWGIRHLDDVLAQAAQAGLVWQQRRAMPANNLLLVWAQPDNRTP